MQTPYPGFSQLPPNCTGNITQSSPICTKLWGRYLPVSRWCSCCVTQVVKDALFIQKLHQISPTAPTLQEQTEPNIQITFHSETDPLSTFLKMIWVSVSRRHLTKFTSAANPGSDHKTAAAFPHGKVRGPNKSPHGSAEPPLSLRPVGSAPFLFPLDVHRNLPCFY